MRLLLVAALLCGVLGSETRVRAQSCVANYFDDELIEHHDNLCGRLAETPLSPLDEALRPTPPLHRVSSSRPVRLLPTHGGKPNHHFGRWANGHSSNLFKHLPLRLCRNRVCFHTVTASPRFYYVIALRRLLC